MLSALRGTEMAVVPAVSTEMCCVERPDSLVTAVPLGEASANLHIPHPLVWANL